MKQDVEKQTNVAVLTGGHRWDRDGERCINCGDKDWYADQFCSRRLLKDKPEE